MSAFVQIFPDPLSKNKPMLAGSTDSAVDMNDSPKFDHVRRPVRGFVLKEDTYATLEVKTKEGKNVLLFDAGGSREVGNISYSPKISNFLVQNIQESSVEKSQVVETFGPAYIFFFGTRPNVLNISGQLLNTADFNWKNEFWANYETYLKGTRCTSNNTIIQLSYDDVIVRGYIISVSADITAETQETVPFSFQMIINTPINTSTIGNSQFPVKTNVDIEPEIQYSTFEKSDTIVNAINELGMPISGTGKASAFLNRALQGNASLSFLYGEQAQNKTNYVISYITGANIRVPIGYAGSLSTDTIKPLKYKYSTFPGYKPNEVVFGKIKDNADEYIARVGTARGGIIQKTVNSTLVDQYTAGKKVEDQAKKLLKSYGVNTDPPNTLAKSLATGAFATVNLGTALIRSKLNDSNFLNDDIQKKINDQIEGRSTR